MYEARLLFGLLFKILVSRCLFEFDDWQSMNTPLKFLSKKWRSEEFSIWRLISVFDHPSILFNDTSAFQFFLILTQKSLSMDNVLQLRPISLNFICCLS